MSIKITVEGHLTKAPELRKTTSGKSVTRFDLAHNFRERVGKDFKDVATIFFSASVWEEDGAAEVAELGLTKGSRVSVDGLWSKRTGTTKEGERRVTDVLTVTKVRLFTENEVARPEAVDDDAEPTPERPPLSRLHNQPASAGRDSPARGPWRIKPARYSWPNTSPGDLSRPVAGDWAHARSRSRNRPQARRRRSPAP
jgi:single-strand DNA-binding protein